MSDFEEFNWAYIFSLTLAIRHSIMCMHGQWTLNGLSGLCRAIYAYLHINFHIVWIQIQIAHCAHYKAHCTVQIEWALIFCHTISTYQLYACFEDYGIFGSDCQHRNQTVCNAYKNVFA